MKSYSIKTINYRKYYFIVIVTILLSILLIPFFSRLLKLGENTFIGYIILVFLITFILNNILKKIYINEVKFVLYEQKFVYINTHLKETVYKVKDIEEFSYNNRFKSHPRLLIKFQTKEKINIRCLEKYDEDLENFVERLNNML